MSDFHPTCPDSKRSLARMLSATPWTHFVRRIEHARPFTRVFNYHGTPPRFRDGLARQLDQLLARYDAVAPSRLESVLREGPGGRSAAIFTFDDGLANNHAVAAPLLEERGLHGIFCIVAEFPSIPRSEQPAWFRERVRPLRNEEHLTDDDFFSLSWEQVRDLTSRGHRIVCHSRTHLTINPETPPEQLEDEIVRARRALEARLPGIEVNGFCWPVDFHAQASAAERLVRTHYDYALCGGSMPLFSGHDPFRVHRTNLEASWPLDVVDLQLSGMVDVKFALTNVRALLPVRAGDRP